MNVILRYCLIFLLLLQGCSSSEYNDTAAADPLVTISEQDVQMREYIQEHNLSLVMVRDPSGMYYDIQEPGDSVHMTLNSVPTIIYTRSNIKDSLLDASFGATDFDGRKLKDHIVGWQVGLQKVGRGGKIFMIIPSPLAFGTEAVTNIIPANSILICQVEVVDFN